MTNKKFDTTRYCEKCYDLNGMVPTERNGARALMACPDCQQEKRQQRRAWMNAVRTEEMFQEYSLTTLNQNISPSMFRAWVKANRFCEEWLPGCGKGVIFTGSYGLGKTHLAVGMMRELLMERGARTGRYLNERRHLQGLRDSYDDDSLERESSVLYQAISPEVLVFDEVGTGNITEWRQDKLADVLDTRLNRKLTTIITTNFAFTEDGFNALGRRVGGLCFSRLRQMCLHVEIEGHDYRQNGGQASMTNM